jgi:hypothetical protein
MDEAIHQARTFRLSRCCTLCCFSCLLALLCVRPLALGLGPAPLVHEDLQQLLHILRGHLQDNICCDEGIKEKQRHHGARLLLLVVATAGLEASC